MEKASKAITIKCNPKAPKGINDKEAESPIRERRENPQEEQPATAKPTSALPPTVKLTFPFLLSNEVIVLIINKILIPTSREVITRRTKSVFEKAVLDPSIRAKKSENL